MSEKQPSQQNTVVAPVETTAPQRVKFEYMTEEKQHEKIAELKKQENTAKEKNTALKEEEASLTKAVATEAKEVKEQTVELKNKVHRWSDKYTSEALKDKKNVESEKATYDVARETYSKDYKDKLRSASATRKVFGKLGNWLGVSSKDKLIKDTELRLSEEAYQTSKGTTRAKLVDYTGKRIAERVKVMHESGISNEEINQYLDTVGERYKRLTLKLNNVNLDQEYAKMSEMKSAAWAEQKSRIEALTQKAGNFWEKKIPPGVKKTLGKKWVRFAITTGTIGALSGGIGPVFVVNRSVRLLGGMIGGRWAKYLADEVWNDEEKLKERLNTLEKNFASGKIKTIEYDEKRDQIDRLMTRAKRLKELVVAGGAYAGGLAGSGIYNTLHNTPETLVDSHNQVEHTAQNKDGAQITNVEQKMSDDAYIRHGEGIEHPLTRQLEANNGEFARKLGWDGKENLHHFAQKHAYKIALDEKYESVTTGHHDVRVKWMGEKAVAYELRVEADGSLGIHEHFRGDNVEIHDSAHAVDVDKNLLEKDIEKYEYKHDYAAHPHHEALKAENPYAPEKIIAENPYEAHLATIDHYPDDLEQYTHATDIHARSIDDHIIKSNRPETGTVTGRNPIPQRPGREPYDYRNPIFTPSGYPEPYSPLRKVWQKITRGIFG